MKYRFWARRTLGAHDFGCLTFLYQPLIGEELLSFYYRLWGFSGTLKTWKSLELTELLDLGDTEFHQGLMKLQEVSLLRSYQTPEEVVLELQLPTNEFDFFNTTDRARALEEKIGEKRVKVIKEFFFPFTISEHDSASSHQSEFALELMKAAFQYLEYPEFFPPFLKQPTYVGYLEQFMKTHHLDFALLFKLIEAEKFPLGKDFLDSPEQVIAKLNQRLQQGIRRDVSKESLQKLLLKYRQGHDVTELSPQEQADLHVISRYSNFSEDILLYVVEYSIERTNYQLNTKYIKKVLDSMIRAQVSTLEEARSYLHKTKSLKKGRTQIVKMSGFTDEDFE